ncbi:Chymotrypsinogen B2 [Stylophora pistillata]|uniref:Chymotrypsinogen B2 n=1 Tax=Stylophora pistillata TaxID=50429 RepID=A0A2B4RHY4_STYPI|nr:Chymotrypsinogen B2 [Stylophora pistillata]
MQQLRVRTKCQVATVLGNSFLLAVKGSTPEKFAGNKPGFRSRQCDFTKKSKVELPANKSNDLCQLIQAIESSEEGKAELDKIIGEGNKFERKNVLKAGDCIEEVWKRDREGFFKDQRNNALAVYNHSPSAYEALYSLSILQLPCTQVLKRVWKDGAEQPGIDHRYFQSQEEKFKEKRIVKVLIHMKVPWSLKGGGITSFTMVEDELPVLHDVFSSVIQSGCQKASYIVQFLWCDLTSGFDLIGPLFPVPKSMYANILQQFFMLCLKSFHAYGCRVSIVLWDGASSNLTLLKMLCGCPRAILLVNDAAEDLRARYFVDISFANPEDSSGSPVFAIICPSHQRQLDPSQCKTSQDHAGCGKRSFLSRVAGGEDAPRHSWPWQLSLRVLSQDGRLLHICGGSLIRDEWVVTAEHCVVDQDDIPRNPSFYTVIVEWGMTEGGGNIADTLQQAMLPVQSRNRCSKRWGRLGAPIDKKSMICAGSGKPGEAGGSQGDSDGPYVCEESGKWVLRGDVSWGHRMCRTDLFTVFARISSFRDWIDAKLKGDSSGGCG